MQDAIERAWVTTFRADLQRQLADLKYEHDHAEQAVHEMARRLDRLQGAIDGLDALLAEAEARAQVAALDNGWPIGG